jgi:hypothetical protein
LCLKKLFMNDNIQSWLSIFGFKREKRTTFEQSYKMGNSFPNRAYVIDILHGSIDVNVL